MEIIGMGFFVEKIWKIPRTCDIIPWVKPKEYVLTR